MNRRLLLILGVVVVLLGIVASGALFTVHQTQQALVLQLGEPKRAVSEPGLKVKLPLIQNVLFYERRVLNLDPPVQRVILADQKPLLVDTYARYRISDPLRFYQTVRTEGTAGSRLGTIINASARGVLGNVNLASVLSEERIEIMLQIRDQVNVESQRFGIDVVDVRLRRSDLPDETSQAVYDRMKSEREREAAEFRAQGFEQAQRIRAGADREATVIRAEAEREAEILRGEGEGERTRILNDAYGKDKDFFNFYRSMQAYNNSLGEGTYMVISPDGEFADFFDAVGGRSYEGGAGAGGQ
ncbi:MAG: protease modulator HflC [Kiloniellales bacterium]|nr:protease modulator HflC [Kiloniellales bacterium]